jgi:hypothetical protein
VRSTGSRRVALPVVVVPLLGLAAGRERGPLGPTMQPRDRGSLVATTRFTACTRQAADPTSSNLRPVAAIDASNDKDEAAQPIPHGVVRLEHATDLVLTDGRLGAGSGYEAATGAVAQVTVARASVTAPVTLAVLDSPESGRRVAYVEVRIKATPPVSWQDDEQLGIGTDGGDGGFVRGTAPEVGADNPQADDYVDAFFPDGNSASGNVCVLGFSGSGQADSVLFSTGYGDGGYPTFVGRDAQGDIASVVSFGFVLPWADSGLPGPSPHYDFG